MPCFIRIIRRLGIELPSNERSLEWLESELKRELGKETHDELRDEVAYLEAFFPDRLRELINAILKRKQKKEEMAIV